MLLWKGPSQLDGKPIVVLATSRTRNEKTGDMVQVWILPDMDPSKALKTGKDFAVCGDCPIRDVCYVIVANAPRSVYDAYRRGRYDSPQYQRYMRRELETKAIRLGAYGDPCAVPFDVWATLLASGNGRWTGYTHQFRQPWAEPYRQILMASVETLQGANEARAKGWRFFMVKPAAMGPVPLQAVECLADSRGLTCEECGICNGAIRSSGKASIWITVHGARRKNLLPVVSAG